jgi:hypothetical protein
MYRSSIIAFFCGAAFRVIAAAVNSDYTANPKQIEDFSANLESHLDGVVSEDGRFTVKDFKLGSRFH